MFGSPITQAVLSAASALPAEPAAAIPFTYAQIVEGMPSELRALGNVLPARIGVAARGWEEFSTLPPLRDLPLYAAEDGSRRSVSRTMRDRFRVAHYCAGFYGLVADRLADGQVTPTPDLYRVRRCLGKGFTAALAVAIGDATLAKVKVRAAMAAWRRAVALEKRSLTAGRLALRRYRMIVRGKVRWLILPALLMLHSAGLPDRATALERAWDLLLLAIQGIDDAVDAQEDERLRGASYPQVLGIPAGGLIRAAPKLLRLSSAQARAAGCFELAAWLLTHAQVIGDWPVSENHLQAELASLIVVESLGSQV